MKTFSAPVEEILFTIEHVAQASRISGWDGLLVREVVQQFATFAAASIAPLNATGDQEGCRLVDGRVKMPAGFRDAYLEYAAQGWPALSAPEAAGGQEMPAPVGGMVSEIFAGACHALQMVVGLAPGAIRTLRRAGSPGQQQRYLPSLASGECLATMCLTESQAGSDLSAIRMQATEEEGGWVLNGEKIFISGGNQDLTDNILHLVLARSGANDTAEFSLFACSSNDGAERRNKVTVARIEEKLGIRASPTCHLVFDGAAAELIGKRGEGLKAMFTMMNHGRLDVALQGVAHAARACDVASSYAAERVQGVNALTRKRSAIDQHSPIAAMLDLQAALELGARAIAYEALVALELDEGDPLLDFLTPVCKVFCTDAGVECADIGIQILGGYGYLSEYGIEQTWRDARICKIYEGTNEIHAMTVAGRCLRHKGGLAADRFAAFIEESGSASGTDSGLVDQCLNAWKAAREIVAGSEDFGAFAEPFMKLSGLTAFAAAWLKLEAAAHRAPDPARIRRLAQFVRRYVPIEVRRWSEKCVASQGQSSPIAQKQASLGQS